MKKICLLIIGIFLMNLAFSQTASPELISSSGNSFNNATYQLDWSIGECITATHTAGDYVITQGFHHDSYIITLVEDLATDINITVYPNPTTDLITIKTENSRFEEGKGEVFLININGKVLLQEKINETEKQLNFSVYTSGVYFLTVKQENQVIKNFKIIKN